MSVRVTAAQSGVDPFGTARLRRGVLDAWGAGPARFREDANAEEDLALGGYRDRLVVEPRCPAGCGSPSTRARAATRCWPSPTPVPRWTRRAWSP